MTGRLGNWLSWQRLRTEFYRKLFFTVFAFVLVVSIFRTNAHPHFGLDSLHLFWAVFGFVVCVVMIAVLKKIVFPLLSRPEDFYEQQEKK